MSVIHPLVRKSIQFDKEPPLSFIVIELDKLDIPQLKAFLIPLIDE